MQDFVLKIKSDRSLTQHATTLLAATAARVSASMFGIPVLGSDTVTF